MRKKRISLELDLDNNVDSSIYDFLNNRNNWGVYTNRNLFLRALVISNMGNDFKNKITPRPTNDKKMDRVSQVILKEG